MKTRQELEKILREQKPYLEEKFKVKEIGFFGSYSRGEESEASDLDILVGFGGPIGWEFIDLQEHLEKILGIRVDLVTVNALRPQIKDRILQEVIYA